MVEGRSMTPPWGSVEPTRRGITCKFCRTRIGRELAAGPKHRAECPRRRESDR